MSANKCGKKEGFLNPILKSDVPLHTIHMDHLGPLPSTAKSYKYIFVMHSQNSYGFIQLSRRPVKKYYEKWNYIQTFLAIRIASLTDRGTAFTANIFEEYCVTQKIHHILITTGIPRGNGQVERVNRTIISILSKMTVDDPMKWVKFVSRLQKVMNSTICRSINKSPFELFLVQKC